MKRIASSLGVAALLALLWPSHADAGSSTRTLTGTYQWGDRTPGDIEAIFTPAGDGAWDVAFHFDFRKRARVFSGTAQGSFEEGSLEGEVYNESESRTFTFKGRFDENGDFHGTHAETTPGRAKATGTISLASPARTLAGTYRWGDDAPAELEAIFTPTAEGQWEVAFHFDFRGRARVFSGIAEGSLTEGKLSGEVYNESESRTFVFEGSFDDDHAFKGTHAETTSGKPSATGTLSLDSAL